MGHYLSDLINPKHSAVVVVDLQNDFCHSDGAFAKLGRDVSLMQKAAYNTEKFLLEARMRNVPVIFIQTSHNQWTDSPSWLRKRKETGPVNCRTGTWGERFFVVRHESGETVVVKHRYSAFIGTNLDLILRSRGIKTLILTGVGTSVCVESTARDGFMLDYDIVILSDCTGETTLESHNHALEGLMRNFGYVVTSGEVLEAWAK